MRRAILQTAVFAILLFLCPFWARAQTVRVDGATRYQTMDGFGGSESWRLPPASMYPTLFDDLGVSILRFQMFAYTESLPDQPGDEARDNDNDDPFVIDWNGVRTGFIDAFAPLLQAAQSRGVKIIGTTWSPPAWMKNNNEVETCGSFLPGYEDEVVEFILIWVKGMQMYHGVHIDSVTVQNEPDTSASWPDCRYTASQIRDIVKLLGARFEAEGITTRIHAPDVTTLQHFGSFADAICQDAVAKGYVDSLATHPYGNNFPNPDNDISLWTSVHGTASGCGKRLWQTEYGNGANDSGWNQALLAVHHVHNALVHGQVAAWLTYELYKAGGGDGGIIGDTGPYSIFFALKQYYRYVRPGAVRIDASSSDGDILATAFEHAALNTLTLVMINRGTNTKTTHGTLTNLSGAVSSLSQYRSSDSEDCVDLGPLAVQGTSFSVTLPARSITTLTGPIGAAQNQPPAAVASAAPISAGIGEMVDFDGSGSSDADGNIVSYEWDFDYDGITFVVAAGGPTTSNAYASAGTHTAALRVTDDDGATDIASVDINVACVPDCDGKACGHDSCGGSCGTCTAPLLCDAQGQCVCPQGTTECSGQCMDLSDDHSHCGSCDHACGVGEDCIDASCVATCVDTDSDGYCDDDIDQDCSGADEYCGGVNGGCGCGWYHAHGRSHAGESDHLVLWMLLAACLMIRRRVL